MKKMLVLAVVLASWCAGCMKIEVEQRPKSPPPAPPPAPAKAEKNAYLGTVRHVVLFKFKDSAAPEQIKAVEEKFRQLPSRIPQILAFEWGTDISPEKKSEGFTHCFFLTFATPADRDAYLPHPAHKEFGASLRPILDKVLVVDYVAKD